VIRLVRFTGEGTALMLQWLVRRQVSSNGPLLVIGAYRVIGYIGHAQDLPRNHSHAEMLGVVQIVYLRKAPTVSLPKLDQFLG
jgi:hypothetical protein